MLNLNRSNFQAHPFHLVSPSPWPLYTSISLLSLTTSAVLSFHGFGYAEYNLIMSLTSLILAMSFWWRDVIAEGKTWLKGTILSIYHLNIAKAIPIEDLEKALSIYNANNDTRLLTNNPLGYYLAGLLGDKKPGLLQFSLFKSINPLPVTVLFTSKRSKSTYRPESTCTALVVWGVNLYSGFRTLRLSNGSYTCLNCQTIKKVL